MNNCTVTLTEGQWVRVLVLLNRTIKELRHERADACTIDPGEDIRTHPRWAPLTDCMTEHGSIALEISECVVEQG